MSNTFNKKVPIVELLNFLSYFFAFSVIGDAFEHIPSFIVFDITHKFIILIKVIFNNVFTIVSTLIVNILILGLIRGCCNKLSIKGLLQFRTLFSIIAIFDRRCQLPFPIVAVFCQHVDIATLIIYRFLNDIIIFVKFNLDDVFQFINLHFSEFSTASYTETVVDAISPR